MLEMKITIEVPQLANAINNLANALMARQTATTTPAATVQTAPANVTPITPANTMPVTTPAAPVAPMAMNQVPVQTMPVAQTAPTAIPTEQANPMPVQTMPVSQTAPATPATGVQPMPNANGPVPMTPAANIPVSQAPQYTKEQIMSAGAILMDAGRTNELMGLLQSFGVQSVMALDPSQLGAFATAMRELGAQI